ncbi:hypothetical protein [Streptomyces sp. DW26H14]|uniref:hypothetical protein n=1 Tax=Streptomyces sp. DW26H14 TaxID=3435395 RepID=UPI00403D7313
MAYGTPAAGGDPAERALLSLDDPLVRVIDAAPVPSRGADGSPDGPDDVLVRLQSFATGARTVRLSCGFPVADAEGATFLSDPAGPVTLEGNDVLLEIARLGSTVVRLGPARTG